MNKMRLVEQLWDYLRMGQAIEKCDCILGLGCPDLLIPTKCAELYGQGYGDIVIFSGGLGKGTKGLWRVPEAEKFAEIAMGLGVPPEKIYIESKSTNTGENIRFTKALIEKDRLSIDSFLMVHKPFMERRSYATFSAAIPRQKCFITSPNISFEAYFDTYGKSEAAREELIHTIVGDLQRIKVYPKFGWQIEQHIPDEVWHAYEVLLTLGYDKYMITGM
ncbi:MAG: YdcF family protein [Clostridia bacterium]|nr:YdcF family protein [Clostridia bacterium]